MKSPVIPIIFPLLLLISCGGNGKNQAESWTEQDVSRYVVYWSSLPKSEAQQKIDEFFDMIVSRQMEDTSSHVYLQVTEWVSKYLYDPNSPLRDEDLYLPFVRRMAKCELTDEDRRPGYEYQERMCSLNRYGTKAADFKYRDIDGRDHNLYDTEAGYTVLFFSNPGCESCREIVDALRGVEGIDNMIEDGRIAVLNVYIDEEIDAWREYEPNYPDNWISGYDPEYIIREDVIYNVRAIPSVYLLDSDKRVLMKDVPVERLLLFLNNI